MRNRRFLRFVAVFLALDMIFSLFIPSISYALTAGPTAPEATSFEPVDTTDMVNLLTGDLTYNVPLLEVPGPSGGYPLSLSYHAGILPKEEASWVGLGWTLNPGAINRTVNGYADDHDSLAVTDRYFWIGGERRSASIRVNIPSTGQKSVSAGLSFSNDTYQGFSTGFLLNAGPFQTTLEKGRLDNSLNIGHGPVSVNTNFKSTNVNVGTSWLGVSISSDGGASSNFGMLSVANQVKNNKSINIQSYSQGITIPIYFVSIGYNYTRYWIDERDTVHTYGALYEKQTLNNSWETNNKEDFDSFNLFDTNQIDLEFGDDAAMQLGGSLSSYDDYTVVAQGLSGRIRPYRYQSFLRKQNFLNNDERDSVKYYQFAPNKKAQFRFIGDFSNRLEYNTETFTFPSHNSNPISYSFSNQQIIDEVGTANPSSYDATNNKLAGSREIKYFTNNEITQGHAQSQGFIDTKSSGFSRSTLINNFLGIEDQIGGFMITNESGVTYHYALPAYSFEEYQRSENRDDPDGGKFSEIRKPNRYAYNWYLTGITGPDYVDRGVTGFDEEDWGYWVEFDYGKWTGRYIWRNPGQEFNIDIDSEFQDYSQGVKDVYYLDQIKTKTHTALFVKDIRTDSKSALDILDNLWYKDGKLTKTKVLDESREGGFIPKDMHNRYRSYMLYQGYLQYHTYEIIEYQPKPVSSLKLDRIILLKNEDFSIDKTAGDEFHQATERTVMDDDWNFLRTDIITQHLPDNVLDIDDISSSLEETALKVIDFETDQSLQDKTPNSYDSNLLVGTNLSTSPSSYPLKGKLTLRSIEFKGKNGVSTVPPLKFNYEKNFAFDSDNYDMWGFYKSDFVDLGTENISRRVSNQSKDDLDAWSLTDISTSIGSDIKIEYEPDRYIKTVFQLSNLNIKSIENHGTNYLKLDFFDELDFTSETSIAVGQSFQLLGMLRHFGTTGLYTCDNSSQIQAWYFKRLDDWVEIKEVHSDHLIVENIDFRNFINDQPQGNHYNIQYGKFESSGGVSANFGLPTFLGGQLVVDFPIPKYGGGVRVKSLTVDNKLRKNKTTYSYGKGVTSFEPINFEPNFDRLNSGVNSCMDELQDYQFGIYMDRLLDHSSDNFRRVLRNSRIAPAPGVMYNKVTQIKSVLHPNQEFVMDNSQVHNFEVFNESMLGIIVDNQNTIVNSNPILPSSPNYFPPYDSIKTRTVTIKDHLARIGRPKSIQKLDKDDNIISQKSFIYLDDDLQPITNNDPEIEDDIEINIDSFEPLIEEDFSGQGIIDETYISTRFTRQDYRFSAPDHQAYHLIGIVSKYESFPSILIAEKDVNHLTGITSETKNLKYDFYSGNVTHTLDHDGGNYYLTEITPAYHEYDGMGLAITNGKNMLTQNAQTTVYKVNSNYEENQISTNIESVLNSSVQTWNDEWNYIEYQVGTGEYLRVLENDIPERIWRKHQKFEWRADSINNDGTANYNEFSDFNFDNLSQNNDQWTKLNELTLYDRNSHPLEALDINGNYAATKMNSDQTEVYATVTNAKYDEFAYSGAEDDLVNGHFGGEVRLFAGSVGDTIPIGQGGDGYVAHTGEYSVKTTQGQRGFYYSSENLTLGRTYRASVWCSEPDGQIRFKVNGGAETHISGDITKVSNGWYLIEADIPIDIGVGTNVELWVRGLQFSTEYYWDDFRFHPIDAVMTSYVYNDWGELNYILDQNNLYTNFEYDEAGRLTKTYKESFKYGVKLLSEVDYKFGRYIYDQNDLLVADFTHGIDRIANQPISFNATSNSGLNNTTTYKWHFDDGSNPVEGTSENVFHTFSDNGVYDVRLTVLNPEYGAKQKVTDITIYDYEFDFTISNNGSNTVDICADPDDYQRTLSVSPTQNTLTDTYCPASTYTWSYDNGQGYITLSESSGSLTFNFSVDGTHTFKCRVVDQCGNYVDKYKTITVIAESGGQPCPNNYQP